MTTSDAIPAIPGQSIPRGRRIPLTTALRKDPLRLALLTLIVLSLSRFGGYFGILRVLRPGLLLFVFCVAYAFLHRRKLILTNLTGSWTVRLISALALVAAGSTVFGISLGHAGKFILDNFSKTLAITFLMIVTIRDVADVRRLCWAVAMGGIVLASLSIFVVGISKSTSGVSYDANDVGVFMVMMLPIALMLLHGAATRRERLLALVGVVLLAVTMVKTQSRGAFIGAIIVGLALLLLPGVSAVRRVFLVAAASLTMMLAAPDGYWKSMRTILEDPKADYNWDSINGRRNLAKRGIGYMVAYPVFGIGIDNFRMAEGTISEKARFTPVGHGIRWTSPHNSFVQAGAEGGVPGVLLWLSLIVSNIVIPLRLRRGIPRAWRRGTPDQRFVEAASLYLPVAQLGFAVTAFSVSFAWMEPVYFLSALVLGLWLTAPHEVRPLVLSRIPGWRTLRSRALASLAPQGPPPASSPS